MSSKILSTLLPHYLQSLSGSTKIGAAGFDKLLRPLHILIYVAYTGRGILDLCCNRFQLFACLLIVKFFFQLTVDHFLVHFL